MKKISYFVSILLSVQLMGTSMGFAEPKFLFSEKKSNDAVYVKKHNLVFIAAKEKGVLVVDGKTGVLKTSLSVEGIAESIGNYKDKIYVLSRSKDTSGFLTIIDGQRLVMLKSIRLRSLAERDYRIATFSEDLIAITTGGSSPKSLIVMEPSTGKIVSKEIRKLVYGHLGLDVRGDRLYLPSAYPGEVIVVRVTDIDGISVEKRVDVWEDWLHDVKLVTDKTAVVAGHLSGVGLFNLETKKYEKLSDLTNGSLMVEKGRVYVVGQGKLQKIHLKTRAVSTVDTVIAKGRVTLLGVQPSGKLLVFVQNKGIVLSDI